MKPFFAWQIELTTRCPLRCRMCIREGIKDWQSDDMSLANFRKLVPYLKDVERVVLEGWGESLLHKDIIEIIRLVKAEGPEVGFVTSGMGLDEGYISELINAGVDFMGFSLSGCTQRTHDSIRIPSDFQEIIQNIKILHEIKMIKKLKEPRIHIVYLMLKDNILEVPSLIGLARDIGIRDVVLINLTHITNEWQDEQKVFRCENRGQVNFHLSPFNEILQETERKAKELKVNLKRPSLFHVDVAVCEEDPLRNLYISTGGEVSPCVYLYPPVPSPFKRLFCGREYKIEKLSFGNLFKEPLYDIWNKKEYVDFRNRLILREKASRGLSLFLRNIKRLKGVEEEPLPEPPERCKTCHKMLGM